MDIRNFFNAKTKSQPTNKNEVVKNRPKPLISDSSDEDVISGSPQKNYNSKKNLLKRDDNQNKKAAKRRLSNSSSDEFEENSNTKVNNGKTRKIESKTLQSSKQGSSGNGASKTDSSNKNEKLKPVEVEDFFGSSKTKVKETICKKSPSKRKTPTKAVEKHDDPEFEALLLGMDDKKDDPKRKKSPKTEVVKKTCDSSSYMLKNGNEKIESMKGSSLSSKLSAKQDKSTSDITNEKHKNKSPCKKGIQAATNHKKEVTHDLPKSTETQMSLSQNSSKASQETSSSQNTQSQNYNDQAKPSQLWVDKYKPTATKGIIGQQGDRSNMKKLQAWLRRWEEHHGVIASGKPPNKPPPWGASKDDGAWAKAALLSGPPGVGKTTTSYLVAKEMGYEIMETNASDTRSKKKLDTEIADALSNKSVSNHQAKRLLLMDEVDGMAGNEDRGGMGELIQLIKKSKIPVICMCNDRNSPKIRNLANYCFDLRFQKPRAEQIKAAMMSICFKEKIKIAPDALTQLIIGCNQDIRQVLHHLTMIKAGSSEGQEKMNENQAKIEANKAQKTSIKMGPWDVCRKVFTATEQKGMSLIDKSSLFFHDYSIGPLFNQENYLVVTPEAANFDKKKTMVLVSKAADSFCDGDLVEKVIRSNNSWSLLPTEAMFASVIPGEYMSGFVSGQIQFPSWLGKNSKTSKMDRITQELQIHTRLSSGLSKTALNQDFSEHLKNSIINPMIGSQGQEGVQKAVEVMKNYSLLREDLDNLVELTMWEGFEDRMKSIESKVKAAFTRSYNKEIVLPYATNIGSIAKKTKVAIQEPGLEEEDDLENSDDEKDENNIEHDSMIKAKKAKKSTETEKTKSDSKEKKGKAVAGKATKGKGASSKAKK